MLKIKTITSCDIFVGIWALYNLQGVLYPSGAINQVLQFIMILFGIIATIRCLLHRYKPSILKVTLCLTFMYTLYGISIIIFDDGITAVSNSYYLKSSYNSLLPIFLFYYYSERGILTDDRIRRYFILFILISTIVFFSFGQALASELNKDEVTNNMGYRFVSLIPMVYFYYRKPIIQYILMLVCLFFIVLGMKRGAILVGASALIIFMVNGITESDKKRRIISILLSIMFIIISITYIKYMINNSPYFSQRIEQTKSGDASNRESIYGSIWKASLEEDNIFKICFGHGANATVRQCGTFAHQDWLETLYNNGLMGCIILASFYLILLRTIVRNRRCLPSQYLFCFLSLLVISFLTTLFSMSIQDMNISQSMLIGYFTYITANRRSTGLSYSRRTQTNENTSFYR